MENIGHGEHGVYMEKRRHKLYVVIYPTPGKKTTVRLTSDEAADLLGFLEKNRGIIHSAVQFERFR